MIITKPAAADILCNRVTATTTGVITVPAGRWYTCSILLSCSVTIAGTSNPTVTFTAVSGSTGLGPASGTIVAAITCSGLATSAGNNDGPIDLICYGGTNGATLDFAVSGASAASCTINGFLL